MLLGILVEEMWHLQVTKTKKRAMVVIDGLKFPFFKMSPCLIFDQISPWLFRKLKLTQYRHSV